MPRISRRKRWFPEGGDPWEDIIEGFQTSGQAEAHAIGDTLADAFEDIQFNEEAAFDILDEFIGWAREVKKNLDEGMTVIGTAQLLSKMGQTEAGAIADVLEGADKNLAYSIADEFIEWAEAAKKRLREA